MTDVTRCATRPLAAALGETHQQRLEAGDSSAVTGCSVLLGNYKEHDGGAKGKREGDSPEEGGCPLDTCIRPRAALVQRHVNKLGCGAQGLCTGRTQTQDRAGCGFREKVASAP